MRNVLRCLALGLGVLLCASASRAETLGERFTALRDLVANRIAAIPAEGATSKEKAEKNGLTTALSHLDTDSPTLDTDVALAAKVMPLLARHNKAILQDPAANLVAINIRDRLQARLDDPPYFPVLASQGTYSKINQLGIVTQYFIGMGTLAPDPAKACGFFKKALKALVKKEKAASKELVPASSDRLRVSIDDLTVGFDEYPLLFDSKKPGVGFSCTYDSGDDLLTVSFTLVRAGVERHVELSLPGPGPGSFFEVGGAAVLEVDGFPCAFNLNTCEFTISAWDPGTGLAAGSFRFNFQFDPDPENGGDEITECASGQGVFTSRTMVVVP